jgi:hypothetical protein
MVWQPSQWATPPSWKARATPPTPMSIMHAAMTIKPNIAVLIKISFFIRPGNPAIHDHGPVGFVPPFFNGFTFVGKLVKKMSTNCYLFPLLETPFQKPLLDLYLLSKSIF